LDDAVAHQQFFCSRTGIEFDGQGEEGEKEGRTKILAGKTRGRVVIDL
jgi:hypothetical protein